MSRWAAGPGRSVAPDEPDREEGRLGMSRIFTIVCVLATALAGVLLIVGSASANNLTGTTITCTEVSGTFVDFVKVDHPIVWHVSVNGGAFQALPTTETPPGFIGSGTASADISSLTSGFA